MSVSPHARPGTVGNFKPEIRCLQWSYCCDSKSVWLSGGPEGTIEERVRRVGGRSNGEQAGICWHGPGAGLPTMCTMAVHVAL